MKIRLILSFVLLSFFAFISVSNADDSLPASVSVPSSTRELAFLAAPIKTSQDLRAYLEMTEGRHSPLNKLPPNARERFLHSLTWNERGVTGFSYESFREITATEAYQILALFGIQHVASIVRPKVRSISDQTIMSMARPQGQVEAQGFGPGTITPTPGNDLETDYMDFKCSARATCSRSTTDICTGNC
ncbi:hypothetical protein [Janthinobacterium sp. JC611]|uniref:hypothetical protein n=1 Tax=Janthinobacterium sp. JC611 TaxID=2816201 RepID=UPI001BFE0D2E|nr:hypothetical protein [Janthinobacterium sp. JC611]